RGISMHPAWSGNRRLFVKEVMEEIGFKSFPSASLDRVNNDGNYEPGNLRWASKSEQAINRRSSAEFVIDQVKVRRAELAKQLDRSSDAVGKHLRNFPRSNPLVVKFENIWLANLQDTDRLAMIFEHKERQMVANMIQRLPDGVDLEPPIRHALHNWKT